MQIFRHSMATCSIDRSTKLQLSLVYLIDSYYEMAISFRNISQITRKD